MEKAATAVVVTVLGLGAAGVERADQAPPTQPHSVESADSRASIARLVEPGGLRNLLLNAIGTDQPAPGQVRVPIPTDDAVYEIIITKPGVPRSIPVK